MTKELRELTYDQLFEFSAEVFKEVRRRAYVDGYEQGKFDAKMDEQFRKVIEVCKKETPQQARDRVVEKAKKDVEELGESNWTGKHAVFLKTSGTILRTHRVEFIVNKDKRTVVALVRMIYSGRLSFRGIAKCAPDDCFNVHIGKAIALRRALGLEVPAEYLNAPQPTEVRVGDIVKYPNGRIVEILEKSFYDVNRVKEVSTGEISSATTFELTKIIDDSREGVTQ